MPVKPVQISMDTKLLDRIDRDPETRERGRSAFLRSAAELYLAAKKRRGDAAAIQVAWGRAVFHIFMVRQGAIQSIGAALIEHGVDE